MNKKLSTGRVYRIKNQFTGKLFKPFSRRYDCRAIPKLDAAVSRDPDCVFILQRREKLPGRVRAKWVDVASKGTHNFFNF